MSPDPITLDRAAEPIVDALGDPHMREHYPTREAYLWMGDDRRPLVEVFRRGAAVHAYLRSPLALLPFLVIAESVPERFAASFPRLGSAAEVSNHLGDWPVSVPLAVAVPLLSVGFEAASDPALRARHRRAGEYLRWATSATACAQRAVNEWGELLAEGPKGGLDMSEHAVLRSPLTRAALRVALWADPLRGAADDEEPPYVVKASWRSLAGMAWPVPGEREELAGFDRIRLMARARMGEPVLVETLAAVWQTDVAALCPSSDHVPGSLIPARESLAMMARLVAGELREDGAPGPYGQKVVPI
jgi:hypothetical protein